MTLIEYKDNLVKRMSILRKDIKVWESRTGGDSKYLKISKTLHDLKIIYDDVRRTLDKEKSNEQ